MIYRWDDLCESQEFEHDQKFVKAEHWKEACDELDDAIKGSNYLKEILKDLEEKLAESEKHFKKMSTKDLKILFMKKGVTQIELSKRLNVHPSLISLQINKHRLLPDKYLAEFCEFLGIEKSDLVKSMKD